jgi:hypothetical protein
MTVRVVLKCSAFQNIVHVMHDALSVRSDENGLYINRTEHWLPTCWAWADIRSVYMWEEDE